MTLMKKSFSCDASLGSVSAGGSGYRTVKLSVMLFVIDLSCKKKCSGSVHTFVLLKQV